MAKFCIDNKSDVTFIKETARAKTLINISPIEAQQKIKEILNKNTNMAKDTTNTIAPNKSAGRR